MSKPGICSLASLKALVGIIILTCLVLALLKWLLGTINASKDFLLTPVLAFLKGLVWSCIGIAFFS